MSTQLPGPERRVRAAQLTIETRQSEAANEGTAGRQIVGHAAVFNEWTTLYEGRYWVWREVIRPGAFAAAIKEGQDVRALFNHDANVLLGRTTSGTLELTEDVVGLLTRTDPPDTQTVRDLVLTPMERGDLDGMSFAFAVKRGDKVTETKTPTGYVIETAGERITVRYEGEREIEEREILSADLYDVSPVTYPQYTGTDVAYRAAGPEIQTRAAERDRPHSRPAPQRNQFRQWLNETAVRSSGPGTGSAAPGRKGETHDAR
jgi:uncharacterized protein